jgi:hypothetical protein
MPRSERRYFNHCNSEDRVARERYSASAEEREIVGCFLVFHDIGLEPNMVKYPVVERRVVGQPAQLESAYPIKLRELEAERNKPLPTLPLR